MSRKQRLQLVVEKSLGPCAALASNNNQIAYTTGAGVVVSRDGDSQFRVCAPKLLTLEAKSALNLEPNELKTAAAKLKINTISCTAISAKSWLAIGETGHAPRVAVWSPASSAPQIVQIHEFGVHKVAFSPSGDYLATLGTPNDGFLYIWCLKSGKPVQVASNRCISEINALDWISDTLLVTAGVRHLRVWTLTGEPVLAGRNILLGDDAGSKFTCILPQADGFYAATNAGGLFYVRDNQIQRVQDVGFDVHSLLPYGNGYACAGYEKLVMFDGERQERQLSSQAMCESVYLDGAAVFDLHSGEQIAGAAYTGFHEDLLWTDHSIYRLRDKGGPECLIETEEKITDVREFDSKLLVAYQNGTISLGSETFQAHPSDGGSVRLETCRDLALSYGRDNCLQIFKNGTQWQSVVLLGRASKASFVDAKTIVVASNKTICILSVDNQETFQTIKTIPQTSPVQSILTDSSRIIVSTLDKKLTTYDLKGAVTQACTPTDIVGDSLVLTNLAFTEYNSQQYILASGNDKSVVLLLDGETVASQWAHTELIKSVGAHNGDIASVSGDGLFTYRLEEPEETTPVRNRSASPTRVLRSPSPTRRLRAAASTNSLAKTIERPASPSRILRPASPVRARSPIKQPVLAPPPSLKLKQPTDLHAALTDFIASGDVDEETFKLLCRALDKYKDKQAMRYFSQRLSKHFDQ